MSNLSEYLTRPASDHPPYLAQGQKARLFPVLKDKSKEGRCTSIFLSCLSHVQQFGTQMLKSVGQSAGKRAKITTYTEVTLPHAPNERPDGLIVMKSGKREWKALVESKVGNNKLEDEQISAYVKLARKHNIDAVITISNQFTSKPEHHPIKLSTRVQKVAVYHWSWWYIITQAYLLISNTDITDNNQRISDEDQHLILDEMLRFLEHESTGVKRFDRMPPEWTDIVQQVTQITPGYPLHDKDDNLKKIVASWHQEIQDISLMLSCMLGCKINEKVKTKLSSLHNSNPQKRIEHGIDLIKKKYLMTAKLEVPGTASIIELKADIKGKTITASMTLEAPSDMVTNAARINWLINQLKKSSKTKGLSSESEYLYEDVYVRFHWKQGKPKTPFIPLNTLKENSKNKYKDSEYLDFIKDKQYRIVKFEISMSRYLSRRFGGLENFISDLEDLVANFYTHVGQYLNKYQPKPPASKKTRKTNNASSPANVTSDEAHSTAQEEA